MAKNDKNNTKNANEGIRYGPRTGGDYRRSHDAFTGYNDCFYRDRFSDGSISGQRSRGTVGFHCLSAGSCCGDTCCGMGRRTFWRTALLDDGSCDLPDRFFFVRCFSGAAGIGGMPCAAGLWSGRAYNAAYFAAGGDCPQQGDHGGGRHYVHSHASSFAGTDPWTCSGRYRAVCSQLALAVSDQYSGGDSCNPVLCALARRGRGWSTHGEKTPL